MKTLLWISDTRQSGFSYASIILLRKLLQEKQLSIYVLSIDTNEKCIFSDIIPRERIFYCKKDLLNDTNNTVNVFNRYKCLGLYDIKSIINKINPSYIFTINDYEVITLQYEYANTKNITWISYLPIDSINKPEHYNKLNYFDILIAYSEFGKQQLINSGYKNNIYVLNHAISQENFFPNPVEKTKLKQLFLDENYTNHFIVTNFNTFSDRKRIDITLKAFEIFSKDKDDVLLVLKQSNNEIFNKLKKSESNKEYINKVKYIKNLDIYMLNCLYNRTDVGLNTCTGEGWGIVPCEMALCGTISILPDNTVHREIFGDIPYVNCIDTPSLIGRYGIPVNDLQCICKGYNIKNKGFTSITQKMLGFDQKMFSFIICNKHNIIMKNTKIFKSSKALIKYFSSSPELPYAFQILVYVGDNYEFAKRNKLEHHFYKNKDYQIIQLSNIEMDTYTRLFRQRIGLPKVDDIVKLLNFYYYNTEKKKENGEYIRKRIEKLFNEDVVYDQFKNILLANGILKKSNTPDKKK